MEKQVVQCLEPEQKVQSKANLTGIPIQMKQDFEDRCGVSLDDVRVHYHSDMPAKLGALAYTRGTQVHIGPGQEHCLRHELGHVVQQKTMAVPVTEYRDGIPVNTNPGLERGADALAGTAQLQAAPGAPGMAASPPAQLEAFHASVSLIPVECQGVPFCADSLCIDTVKLTGRADTGLKKVGKNGRQVTTQGDHTIADAVVKKYQKILARGMTVTEVLGFYHLQGELLQAENNPSHWDDKERAQSACELAANVVQDVETLNGFSEKGLTIPTWRRFLSQLISDYNTAYARSILATRGTGSGGKGEAAGVEAIRRLRGVDGSKQTVGIDKARFYKMLDVKGTEFNNIFKSNSPRVSAYLHRKLFLMLSQLIGYQGHGEEEKADLERQAHEEEEEAAPERRNYAPFYQDRALLTHENWNQMISEEFVYPTSEDGDVSQEEMTKYLHEICKDIPLSLTESDFPTERASLEQSYESLLHSIPLENMETFMHKAITTKNAWNKTVVKQICKYMNQLKVVAEFIPSDPRVGPLLKTVEEIFQLLESDSAPGPEDVAAVFARLRDLLTISQEIFAS